MKTNKGVNKKIGTHMSEKSKKASRVLNDREVDSFKKDLEGKGYTDLNYLGTGNWGEVYQIYHKHLKCHRAVKILLPKHAANEIVRKRFLQEADKMIKLTHNHIVNIFDLGEPDGKPYYIMEIVKSKHLGKFLEGNPDLKRNDYLEILKQICNVLGYIHSNNIVHLDIKAENILVDQDLIGKGIKLADFGLAHYLIDSSSTRYRVHQDITWMPKSLLEHREKEVTRSIFKPSQDLAYFGKMLEDIKFEKYVSEKFSSRQASLLKKIIRDLMEENFHNAEELKSKLDKLSPTHPPTGSIPEIAAAQAVDSSRTIRIPRQVIVPTTERLLKLIELPEFQRLRFIKQLGPTSLIYPGASHSRFEHSLGAYSIAIEYLSYLMSDPEFDYLFSSKDLTTLLIAVLLHDIGHYAYAHQLEELHDDRLPNHRDVTVDLLCDCYSLPHRNAKTPKLAEILDKYFEISPDEVAKLVKTTHGKKHLSKKEQILASFLDGALDVDKQDYLTRDGLHVGVEYPMHIDKTRLLRSLTISRQYSELAVTEKGKTAVELLIMSRSAMFSEVYWHHTNRAATVMIQRAFQEFIKFRRLAKSGLLSILLSMNDEEILRHIIKNGPKHIVDLVPNPSKWTTSRQVYKRVLTFASHYEPYKAKIYDQLVSLNEKEKRKIETMLVSHLNKKHPNLHIKPHEILIDIPTGVEKLPPVQIVYPKTGMEISLKEITHFDKSIFDQFFKHTKKARVFCHPRIKNNIIEDENDMRELIAEEVDVSIPEGRL